MGDLEVATQDLEALGDRLSALADTLVTGTDVADHGVSELAHPTVVAAMREFRTNWDDNRAHLGDKLRTLGDFARSTADGFEQSDLDLARQIREAVEQP